MTGPVYAPASSRKKALAFNNQSAAGTAVTLTSADCLDCANISWTPNSITSQDPRYTGTTMEVGDILLGVTYDISFEWLIHGPGNTLPAANAFIAGRVLQQLGFTEQRISTAIGPEGFTSGTTSAITLGATAVGTADLYKGLVVNVATVGAAPVGFSMIRAYTSGKVATLARLRATAATGNYTIPSQLTYTYSATDPVAGASVTIWEDGHRLNFIDMIPTGDQTIQMFTSSRDGTDYCRVRVSMSGTLSSKVTEAAPSVSISTAIPPMRDGQDDFAGIQMGGSSATITISTRTAYPPNANQQSGNDPGVRVGNRRTLNLERNKVSLSVVNFDTIAAAQSNQAYQALWGLAAGNYMGVMVANGRLNYRGPGGGQDFDTDTGDVWIDGADKEISLAFPIGY